MTRILEVTDLILRDAHQSLMATRMAMEDMVPACEDLDNAGYWSLECWGGATFDSCIRFLNEDPWERLRTFRKLLPKSFPLRRAWRQPGQGIQPLYFRTIQCLLPVETHLVDTHALPLPQKYLILLRIVSHRPAA